MYKYLFLILGVCSSSFAQVKAIKRPYLLAAFGFIQPKGSFQDMNVPGVDDFSLGAIDYPKGGAKLGLTWKVEGTYFISPFLGLGARIFESQHLVPKKTSGSFNRGTIEDNIFLQSAGKYTFTGMGIGIVPSLPYSKHSIDLKLFFTWSRSIAPNYLQFTEEPPYSYPQRYWTREYKASPGTSFGLEISIGTRIFLTKRIALSIEGQYQNARSTINVENIEHYRNTKGSDNVSLSVSGLSFQMGIAYDLGLKKESE